MEKMAPTSAESIIEATRDRAKFSGHGNALGAAGPRRASFDPENCDYLHEPGQCIAVSPGPEGFEKIDIGVSWDNITVEDEGLVGKLLNKTIQVGVDLDLGCIYELMDGTRGAIQAFGNKFGMFDAAPFIQLSGDETTGDKEGIDELIRVNGRHWKEIKKIVVYVYIYTGVPNWAEINPRLLIDVPGQNDLVVTLNVHNDNLKLCAVGGLENVRDGIKLTNYTEYFAGHEEMDRAFGFGLVWSDGRK